MHLPTLRCKLPVGSSTFEPIAMSADMSFVVVVFLPLLCSKHAGVHMSKYDLHVQCKCYRGRLREKECAQGCSGKAHERDQRVCLAHTCQALLIALTRSSSRLVMVGETKCPILQFDHRSAVTGSGHVPGDVQPIS